MSGADLPRFDADGLVPVVVQDQATRRVLMLGYMNEEAYLLTLERGTVHFWSRSRGRIWEKGETSGNRLHCSSLALDCDADAVLALVHPAGPTCHTGSATCWDDGPLGAGFASLETLWSTIRERIERHPEGSYTARLADEGPDLPARKLVEEATEVLMAAKDHAVGAADDRRLAEEVADTVYHLLVVCAERGLDPALVLDVLAERAS
jgi:phosphoribosyl-ATP pyrophosphohydrolase/phosphoribosyl-AMP cyclohydrolase